MPNPRPILYSPARKKSVTKMRDTGIPGDSMSGDRRYMQVRLLQMIDLLKRDRWRRLLGLPELGGRAPARIAVDGVVDAKPPMSENRGPSQFWRVRRHAWRRNAKWIERAYVTEHQAKDRYDRDAIALRSGRVELVNPAGDVVRAVEGGWNRSRW